MRRYISFALDCILSDRAAIGRPTKTYMHFSLTSSPGHTRPGAAKTPAPKCRHAWVRRRIGGLTRQDVVSTYRRPHVSKAPGSTFRRVSRRAYYRQNSEQAQSVGFYSTKCHKYQQFPSINTLFFTLTSSSHYEHEGINAHTYIKEAAARAQHSHDEKALLATTSS